MNASEVDITTGDKICYLLALSKKSLPSERVYPVMFQMKDRFPKEFPDLDFYYDANKNIHSRELERYLTHIKTVGILQRDTRNYSLTDNAVAHELKSFYGLPEEDQKKLNQMALTLDNILEG